MNRTVLEGFSGQQHQPVMLPVCVYVFSVSVFSMRAPELTAGGALHIITHTLWRHIHLVGEEKGQALIKQP